MKNIVCPNCHTTFQVDESTYAAILDQVRGKEFNAEIERRTEELKKQFSSNEEKVKLGVEKEFEKALSAKDLSLAELKSEIERLKGEISNFEANKKNEILELNSKTERTHQLALAEKDKVINELNSVITAKDVDLKLRLMEERNAVSKTLLEKDKEVAELQGKLELQKKVAETRELQLNEQHKVLLQSKQDEIDRLKDFKLRLSTKMVGETLEQHCATLFEQARVMGMFPEAYWGKDNKAVEGTKGDFIFRDYIDGEEYVSIMFEMKNESDETASKHRNDDFLQKLDNDRKRKNCEYAVLVSMLEQDNDVYNNGIVDKSHVYPKMIVIRPQFFMPVLRLITQAARKGFCERRDLVRQLAEAQSYTADFSKFERNIKNFRDEFNKNVTAAHGKFQKAYDGLDKAIEGLEKQISVLREIKANFEASEQRLLSADKVAEERLNVKRLTHGAPAVRQKIEESRSEE